MVADTKHTKYLRDFVRELADSGHVMVAEEDPGAKEDGILVVLDRSHFTFSTREEVVAFFSKLGYDGEVRYVEPGSEYKEESVDEKTRELLDDVLRYLNYHNRYVDDEDTEAQELAERIAGSLSEEG